MMNFKPPASLPVLRLPRRGLALPLFGGFLVLACFLALVSDADADVMTMPVMLQLLLGGVGMAAGFMWLLASWRPGVGSQRDIIYPWITVFLLVGAGLAFGSPFDWLTWSYVGTIVAFSAPIMLVLTLLTRMNAPTNTCSSSSAMGFCSGGLASVVCALLAPAISLPDTLLAVGIALAVSMALGRTVLCHFIKW